MIYDDIRFIMSDLSMIQKKTVLRIPPWSWAPRGSPAECIRRGRLRWSRGASNRTRTSRPFSYTSARNTNDFYGYKWI